MTDEHEGDGEIPIHTTDTLDDDRDETASDPVDSPADRDLTPREEAALKRVRGLSHLLDEAFEVPGTNYRVGIDPILGIVPGGGDAVAAAISLYPIIEAYRFGASKATLVKMLTLVGIDAVIGSVPLIGPVFDAVWKANMWNLRSFERHVQQR